MVVLCKPSAKVCLEYFQRILSKYRGRRIDVTKIVRKVDPNVASAYIILDRVIAAKPYGRRKPPERKPVDIVRDWLHGREVWRGYCKLDGRWYWIIWKVKTFNWSCKPGYVKGR